MAGKYKCLLCEKEFISESGVKYHINSLHAEVRQAEWSLKPQALGGGEGVLRGQCWMCVPRFPFSLLTVGNKVLKLS